MERKAVKRSGSGLEESAAAAKPAPRKKLKKDEGAPMTSRTQSLLLGNLCLCSEEEEPATLEEKFLAFCNKHPEVSHCPRCPDCLHLSTHFASCCVKGCGGQSLNERIQGHSSA
jgi:hypothetical protein